MAVLRIRVRIGPFGMSAAAAAFLESSPRGPFRMKAGDVVVVVRERDTNSSSTSAVSSDGLVVAGGYCSGGILWKNGNVSNLGFTNAVGVNANSTIVVGFTGDNNSQAVRWVQDTSPSGGTVTPLGSLGGASTRGFRYRPTEYFVNAPPAWTNEFGPSAA